MDRKTHEIIFVNGKNIVLPIKRPRIHRSGSLRFGYTVEGKNKDRMFVGNIKHIYCCYYATNCDFVGSFKEVKKHMLYCEEGEENEMY